MLPGHRTAIVGPDETKGPETPAFEKERHVVFRLRSVRDLSADQYVDSGRCKPRYLLLISL